VCARRDTIGFTTGPSDYFSEVFSAVIVAVIQMKTFADKAGEILSFALHPLSKPGGLRVETD
jgi:hypothetical protein